MIIAFAAKGKAHFLENGMVERKCSKYLLKSSRTSLGGFLNHGVESGAAAAGTSLGLVNHEGELSTLNPMCVHCKSLSDFLSVSDIRNFISLLLPHLHVPDHYAAARDEGSNGHVQGQQWA